MEYVDLGTRTPAAPATSLGEQFVVMEMAAQPGRPASVGGTTAAPTVAPESHAEVAVPARRAQPAQQRWSLQALHEADEPAGDPAPAGRAPAGSRIDSRAVSTLDVVGSSAMRLPLDRIRGITPMHTRATPGTSPEPGARTHGDGSEGWPGMVTTSHWQVRGSASGMGIADLDGHRNPAGGPFGGGAPPSTDSPMAGVSAPEQPSRLNLWPEYLAITAGSLLSLAGTIVLFVANVGGR